MTDVFGACDMCDNDAIGVLAGEAGDYWYCAEHSPAVNLMRAIDKGAE